MKDIQLNKETWQKLKSELQKEWNFISAAELEQTRGSFKSIFGLVQTKCDLHDEEVKAKLPSILKKY